MSEHDISTELSTKKLPPKPLKLQFGTPKSSLDIRLEAEQHEQVPMRQKSLPRKLESLKHTQSVPNLAPVRAPLQDSPKLFDFSEQ